MTDSLLNDDVDFSLKSDGMSLPTFTGTSKDWREQFLPALESHLEGRNLDDLVKLGVGEMLMVQTDGSTQEAKRVRKLGDHCKRALCMLLDVPVKTEPGSRASLEKQPQKKDDAATSSMMTRLLGFQLDVDAGQEDSGPAELQGMSEPEELKGRMHPVYPGEAATKLKMREMIFDRFENIPGDIEAIPVEKFVVTVGDYEKLSSLLWRILNRNAPAPVLLTAKTIVRRNGFELLQRMIIEYGKSSSDRTTADMAVLKTTYIDAVKKDPGLTVAGYVNEMVGARVNLATMIGDDVFKELLTTAFKGSPADGYITQALNTDGIPVNTIVQGLIDRSEGLYNDSVVAKANKAIQQIEVCQLCGDKGHMAKQCMVLNKELRDRVRDALRPPDFVNRAEQVCDHCGRHGHTKARCRQLQECHRCGQVGHWKDQCPLGMTARKPPAGYSCTYCKERGDHYSADCTVKAKANISQADLIAAVAAEFNKCYEAEQK